MSSLDNILAGMEDTLFQPAEENNYKSNGNISYAEDISKDIAMELLEPGDFDDKYSYKLMTTAESFVVTKYNPNTLEIVSDYTIDKDTDVQSFTEMERAVLLHDRTSFLPKGEDSDTTDYDAAIDDDYRFKPDWRFYVIIIFLLLLAISVALHVFVSSLF